MVALLMKWPGELGSISLFNAGMRSTQEVDDTLGVQQLICRGLANFSSGRAGQENALSCGPGRGRGRNKARGAMSSTGGSEINDGDVGKQQDREWALASSQVTASGCSLVAPKGTTQPLETSFRIQQATECHCSLMEQVDASRKEEASHGVMRGGKKCP